MGDVRYIDRITRLIDQKKIHSFTFSYTRDGSSECKLIWFGATRKGIFTITTTGYGTHIYEAARNAFETYLAEELQIRRIRNDVEEALKEKANG
jgi:hypothetical protein